MDNINPKKQKFPFPSDIDHRFFSAFLSIVIAIMVKIDQLTFKRLVLLLVAITILSFWMKISININKNLLVRMGFYISTVFISFTIGPIMHITCTECYSPQEIHVLQYLFPSVISFWLISVEINKINWKRQWRDINAFGDTSDG